MDLVTELMEKNAELSEQEVWKDIPRFEGFYQASNLGRIKSLQRIAIKEYRGNRIVNEKIMKGTKNEDGYLKVHLTYNGKDKGCFIHRLVALTFIDNPENKPQINHKDGNKLNNCITNLEWVTNLENQKHAWRNGLKTASISNNKTVYQFDLNNNFIKKYDSISEAARQNNICVSNISLCCNNLRSRAGNYIWRFEYGK